MGAPQLYELNPIILSFGDSYLNFYHNYTPIIAKIFLFIIPIFYILSKIDDIKYIKNNSESENKLNRYRVWTYQEGTCGICLENFNWLDKLVELPCKHVYHSKCIMRWFENKCTCPTCRFKLNTGENNDGFINDIFRLTRLTLNVLEYSARNLL